MTDSTPWWKSFFHGAVLDVQRALYAPPITTADADTIVSLLAPKPGARLLDVPCGNGRIAIELARRGYAVDGVDLTAELIDDARRDSDDHAALNWRVGDMRELPVDGRYDGVYCFGNSFGYLDDAGHATFLKAVVDSLRPGGSFLLQTNVIAESILARPPQRTWYEFGGVIMLHDSRYEARTATLTSDYRFVRENAAYQLRQAVYRIYTCRQLVEMCQTAGFDEIELLADGKAAPFAAGSPVLLLRARRGEL